jgi:hypothetical protein
MKRQLATVRYETGYETGYETRIETGYETGYETGPISLYPPLLGMGMKPGV